MENQTLRAKVSIIGDSGVGKSSIITSLTKSMFMEYTNSTIGASFVTYDNDYTSKISDSKYEVTPQYSPVQSVKSKETKFQKLRFELWDTAGQERFHSLIPMYIRGSKCILIVFDRSDPETLQNCIDYWIPHLISDLGLNTFNTNNSPLVVLIENKSDFPHNSQITKKAIQVAEENHFVYWETSARKNHGIKELFNYLTNHLNLDDPLEKKSDHSNISDLKEYTWKSQCCKF